MTADLSQRLTDLVSASAWAYAVVLALVAADAVLPVLPGEAVVIAAGVLAARGDLEIGLVAAAAALGGFAGDNASFGLGATVGEPAARRLARRGRGLRLAAWARRQLHERGRLVIVGARFVPGGRTATTFAAGTVGLPWRRFATADAVAALLWAGYVCALGYLGGSTFHDRPWRALALSLAVAALVALLGEGVRRATTGRA